MEISQFWAWKEKRIDFYQLIASMAQINLKTFRNNSTSREFKNNISRYLQKDWDNDSGKF